LITAGFTTSGYDINTIMFEYDYKTDYLHIGIACYVICGDADGDGNADTTSNPLGILGGIDQPQFAGSESFLIAFDLGAPGKLPRDGVLDVIIGYPAGQAIDSQTFPCGNLFGTSCFGLYYYSGTSYSTPQYRFKFVGPDAALGNTPASRVIDNNPNPTSARPHLEWTIKNFNTILSSLNFPPLDQAGIIPYQFGMLAFAGSFDDDGIGEDFLPSTGLVNISFACISFDACDVCGGNGQTCADCAGVPNGKGKYDSCDVCNGNGNTCRDCRSVVNGGAKYDVCDVCNGNGNTCLDCAKIPNGPTRYDACDVCGGNSNTCGDCAGIPNGATKYDVCDICGGNGQTCRDCAGTPNGPAKYDECDVCNGDGTACICDNSQLTEICNFPDELVRSSCVRVNGQKVHMEVWNVALTNKRVVKYFNRFTETEITGVQSSSITEC